MQPLSDAMFVGDICALFDPPVRPATVYQWMRRSQPGKPYADDPFPEPVAYLSGRGLVPPTEKRPGMRPVWRRSQASEIIAWRARVLSGRQSGHRTTA